MARAPAGFPAAQQASLAKRVKMAVGGVKAAGERALAARRTAREADLQARASADRADGRRAYRAQALRDAVAVATGVGVWVIVGMMAAHGFF